MADMTDEVCGGGLRREREPLTDGAGEGTEDVFAAVAVPLTLLPPRFRGREGCRGAAELVGVLVEQRA